MAFKDIIQSADWKTEKHVPVIDAPAKNKRGSAVKISVSVGKQIDHPNTSEHHIAWIDLYFLPNGEKFAYQVGHFDFSAHAASTQGPNTSTICTQPEAMCSVKTDKSGTILALSYCNIHGLWESSQEIIVE